MSLFVRRFNSCCCGFSLKTGTEIILWLDVISGIFSLVSLIALLLVLLGNNEIESSSNENEVYIFKKVWPIYFIQNLFLLIFGIIAAVGLYGVYKKKPWLLKPILIIHSVQVVLSCIAFIATLIGSVITLIEQGKNLPADVVIFLTVILSIEISIIFLAWYFTMIMYSYYFQLVEELDLSQVDIQV